MFKNKQRNFIYFLIIFIPAAFFFVNSQPLISFKFSVIQAVRGPLQLISLPALEIKKILFYHRTFDEYKKLKKRTDSLQSRIIGLDEVMVENARLKKLLGFKQQSVFSTVAAHVIGREPSSWNSTMIIDKGADSGIQRGSPVVSSAGVVGKVVEVDKNISKVMLLIDPHFKLAALVKSPRETGLVSGSLQGLTIMKYVSEDANIRLGEEVITSKLSSSFPESIPLGKIIKINKRNNSITECIIEPAVSFSQIEEVLVILQD